MGKNKKSGITFWHHSYADTYWKQLEKQGYTFDIRRGFGRRSEYFDDIRYYINNLCGYGWYITERKRHLLLKKLERNILRHIRVLGSGER